MKVARLSPQAWSFLADVAATNYDLSAKLRDEIRDGTFTHLDGEPCRVVLESPEPRHAAPVHQQGAMW